MISEYEYDSHVNISRIQTPVKRPVCHKEPGNNYNPKVRIVLEYHVIDKLYIGISWAVPSNQPTKIQLVSTVPSQMTGIKNLKVRK